ncbi:hypothetical protein HELRODRAFT_164291 [Helobdella robusta]|uniref:Uncharacterized protein n=1 Tax=Helobdella robusta TaxID=6412 RepID=T1EV80_HELRO|nr:hypothetical protein HELRODRAFT_164291 [Helobdella robusta]ESN94447.1 hypothetical protein HELRODRAFT_164291 [Helobdella robusta]
MFVQLQSLSFALKIVVLPSGEKLETKRSHGKAVTSANEGEGNFSARFMTDDVILYLARVGPNEEALICGTFVFSDGVGTELQVKRRRAKLLTRRDETQFRTVSKDLPEVLATIKKNIDCEDVFEVQFMKQSCWRKNLIRT